MHGARVLDLLPLLLAVTLLTASSLALGQSPAATSDRYSINNLYAIPSIIGREPGGAAWSPDGKRLAFLWNDTGEVFRDVWVYDVSSGNRERLTDHGARTDKALEHPGIGEVRWFGPGGDQLAYTLDGELYVTTVGGTSRRMPLPVSGIQQLSASPQDGQLALVARGEQASGGALWLLEDPTAEDAGVRLLVDPGHADSSVDSHQWSSDGARVSFALRHMGDMAKREIHYYVDGKLQIDTVSRAFPGEPNLRFDVGVVEVSSGKSHLLQRQDDTFPVWNYGLSSDGRNLFVNESDPYVKLHRIEVFEVASGKRETFYRERDPRHLRPDWRAAWAPEDEGLVILTDRDGYLHLYHQKAAGGEPERLTTGTWEISDFAVAAGTGAIYFRANKSHLAERQLYRLTLGDGTVTQVSDEMPGTHHVTYAPGMLKAASVFSNDVTPPDLYIIDFSDDATTRVTNSPTAAFKQQDWADVRYIEFESHVDGTPLLGRLSIPPKFNPLKRYPLIVGSVYSDSVRNQWGGRTAHPTWGLDQHLVAAGYLLLNVNVRGSWGQGREHNQGLLHGYGNVDIDDLHSGVLHLVKQGHVDPERVGIWGSSYGGLMTMMSLFKKPEVYAVGIAGAPATNVAHAYPEQMWVMGPATGDDMPGRYEKQSPLYHTAGLEDPLMIIHGTRDEVVLYSDTIAVVNRLIANEQPFELVTLPGVGHGWDAEMNDVRRFSFEKMVEFFNRYLNP